MTREEYLRELQTGLEERLSEAETADIVAEYAGFFESGREEGRTEEDIAAALGSPAGLVRMLAGERDGRNGAPAVPPAMSFAVFPPRASLGRRAGAFLIDRLVVFLGLALLAVVTVLLLSAGAPSAHQEAPAVIEEHLRSDSAVRVEIGAIVWHPAFFLLAFLVPQMGIPMILPFILTSWIYPEAYKDELSLLFSLLLLGLLLSILYKPVLECLWNGRTLGKRLMGIRVAAPDGGKAGIGRLLVRELVGDLLLSNLSGGVTTLVSIFTASIGREHKSVPDYIASSIVIVDGDTRRKRRQP